MEIETHAESRDGTCQKSTADLAVESMDGQPIQRECIFSIIAGGKLKPGVSISYMQA